MERIVDHFATAKRSPSAEMVAVLRAAHQVIDQPVVHEDSLAMRIIGERGRRWLEDNSSLLDVEYVRGIRSMVAIRGRMCEDELRAAVARGATQYVVLGAGLDTFAYRQPEFARALTIFEVDEPSTQAWKLERLQEARLGIPGNLRFVPVDFTTGTLAGALAAAGFDRAAPVFFSWLGVSYYLPLESIVETMRFIAGQDAASEVIFDFALDEPAVPPGHRDLYREMRRAMAAAAEPWQSWLDPEALRRTLLDLGFTSIELIDSNVLIERFITVRDELSIMALALARKARA
jgi:methyltransferase (TIGR00027 family)